MAIKTRKQLILFFESVIEEDETIELYEISRNKWKITKKYGVEKKL